MKKYKKWGFIFLFVPFFVSAEQIGSTLFACYKENENHIQITACLDNAHRNSRLQLDKMELELAQKFAESKLLGVEPQNLNRLNLVNLNFQRWKDSQCQMVEASYSSADDSKQAYLSCLVDLNKEQISRLTVLADKIK